ncbi:MAG: hypothetical protein NT118_05260 [Lentisphaerae bacterium]|nr:hypothetical protein [Lentisphaerota bacterium]
MDKRLGANARSNPVAGCNWLCDNAPESIRICRPSGCGSFWLKEEYSSVGVSTRYASVQKFFLSFQKSSATRHMRIFKGSLDLFSTSGYPSNNVKIKITSNLIRGYLQ